MPVNCIGGISGATYTSATDRYPHGALGDPWEWGALSVSIALKMPCRAGLSTSTIVLPQELVFEDVAPILADLDGDGEPEVLTVESHRSKGARLAIYARRGARVTRIAATPFIGQRNRWLAQLGAADLDGDGRIEIAYVDRPHLAKTLRIWRLEKGALTHIADQPDVTNHRFGEKSISGGIRHCAGNTEVITADADWSHVVATRFDGHNTQMRVLGRYTGPESLNSALACRPL
ncbi:FG-GAP repeat domain-containing protein [Thalassovita taeanensis]|uniref:FG-GAP repeat domain-containing protein n=1 Tax=Thalassovita taeanensis TaxID=657014 RepID=UPI001FE65542|nr:VCBS repeat-containing protein [Thalassovita taeanensis]